MEAMRAVVLMVAVLACAASATPYQAMGFRGGVEETRLARGRWLIHVRVNSYTSASTAFEYLHRRAAELCQHDGYGSYDVVDSERDRNEYVDRSGFAGPGPVVREKPEITAVIRCTGVANRGPRQERNPAAPPDEEDE